MKNSLSVIILISIISFCVQSCSKESIESPKTTSLEITLRDDLGNLIQGATVKLYPSETDYKNQTNSLSVKTSNASGVVTFDNLTSIKYYFSADKDCLSNAFGGVATASSLVLNQKNNSVCVLGKTGTLKFTNLSSNPYDIYINGTLTIQNMPGGAIRQYLAPAANYSIRVLQKSGYILFPTDKTYTGSLTCGLTLTTTFP